MKTSHILIGLFTCWILSGCAHNHETTTSAQTPLSHTVGAGAYTVGHGIYTNAGAGTYTVGYGSYTNAGAGAYTTTNGAAKVGVDYTPVTNK